MCGKNIVAMNYYDGGMPVATTTNVDKMTRTTREMTEAQRDSYEALTENLAAAQRRSARFAQDWMRGGAEALREQTEHNLRTAEAFARSARKQQEGFRALTQELTTAFETFYFSPFTYAQDGLNAVQKATEQGAEVTEQVARQGLRVAEEATEQTDKVLRKTEEATREAELRAAVLGALKTADYDGLTVEEISERLDGLPAEQLRKVREFEKQNKDRETLVGQIDRKIRANNNS